MDVRYCKCGNEMVGNAKTCNACQHLSWSIKNDMFAAGGHRRGIKKIMHKFKRNWMRMFGEEPDLTEEYERRTNKI